MQLSVMEINKMGEGVGNTQEDMGSLQDWMVSEVLSEESHLSKDFQKGVRTHKDILGKNIPNKGNIYCKSPDVESDYKGYMRKSEEFSGSEKRGSWGTDGISDKNL